MSGAQPDAQPDAPVTLDDIRAARELLKGIIRDTPVQGSRPLSERSADRSGSSARTSSGPGRSRSAAPTPGSRGSTADEAAHGVVAASAGNHAQGVALAATLRGHPVDGVHAGGRADPEGAGDPAYGAEVRFHGSLGRRGAARGQGLRRARPARCWCTRSTTRHRRRAGHGGAGDPRAGARTCAPSSSAPAAAGCSAGIALAVKSTCGPTCGSWGCRPRTPRRTRRRWRRGTRCRWNGCRRWPTASRSAGPGRCRSPSCRTWSTTSLTVSEESLSRALLLLPGAGQAGGRAGRRRRGRGAAGRPARLRAAGRRGALRRQHRPAAAAAGAAARPGGRRPVPVASGPASRTGRARWCSCSPRSPRPTRASLEVEHVRTDPRLRVDEVEVRLQLETRGEEHCASVLDRLRAAGYPLVLRLIGRTARNGRLDAVNVRRTYASSLQRDTSRPDPACPADEKPARGLSVLQQRGSSDRESDSRGSSVMTNAIEADGLVKTYGDVAALDGLDLRWRRRAPCWACSGPTAPARPPPCAS